MRLLTSKTVVDICPPSIIIGLVVDAAMHVWRGSIISRIYRLRLYELRVVSRFAEMLLYHQSTPIPLFLMKDESGWMVALQVTRSSSSPFAAKALVRTPEPPKRQHHRPPEPLYYCPSSPVPRCEAVSLFVASKSKLGYSPYSVPHAMRH
jgi:hypothetical protein